MNRIASPLKSSTTINYSETQTEQTDQSMKDHSAIALVVVMMMLLLCLLQSTQAKTHTEQLVFFDDFQRLDTNIWKHAITMGGGGNWEFQQYVNNRSVSWVDNGILYLKPMTTEDYIGSSVSAEGAAIDLWGSEMPDQCTTNFQYGCYRTAFSGHILNPVTSARVRSAEAFSFKYGRVEVKAKLPIGDWLWPAIWMMPRWNRYGAWPSSGEIDIMESRGNKVYLQYNKEGGAETFASTMHWGPYYGANGYELTHTLWTKPNGKLMHDDFHIFGLYWDQERLYTYIDDPKNVVLDVDLTEGFWAKAKKAGLNWDAQKLFNPWATAPARAPFNQEFFLILQNAVGAQNGYFADNIPGKPWKNSSPSCFKEFWDGRNQWLPTWKGNDSALQIDYVKVWIFPDISTYTFNNATAVPNATASIALPMWVYFVAIIGGLLSIAGAALGGLSFAMLVAKRVRKERFGKEKRAAAARRDQPMAAGSEIALEEETRRTTIATH